ncbi:MAG: membrane protein [Alphaproteobacteria bacterium]|nr:MAG: membrane protein [Alphaproteobacteria bacterium]
MSAEDFARFLHVGGAALLIGTGAGIAFFMVMAARTRDPRLIAHVAGTVVVADFLFTATAVVAQPLTGLWLAAIVGWPLTAGWLVVSILLYVAVGAFWLPVIVIQMRLRDLAAAAAAAGTGLPAAFDRLYRVWFACGWPAFAGVLAILLLMLARPDIAWP